MDEWYCRMGGQDYGPMPFQQLFQATSAGQVPPDAWVRFAQQDWIPITSMPQLAGFFARPATPVGGTHVTRKSSSSVNLSSADIVNQAPRPVAVPVAPQRVAATVPQRGTPVVAPVAVQAVVPQGIPMGSVRPVVVASPPPVASSPPMISPVVTRAAKAATPAPPASQGSSHAKKKGNPYLPLILMGGAAAGLLLVLLVVVLMSGGTTKKPAEEELVASADTGKEETPPVIEAEVSPSVPKTSETAEAAETSPAVVTPAAQTKKNTPAITPTSTAQPTAGAALFSKHTNWKDPRRALKNRLMRLEVVQAWLAVDEKGTRISTASSIPVKTDKPQEAEPAAEAEEVPATELALPSSNAAKFVCVQVRIINPGTVPLTYQSWNGPTADAVGMLAGEDGIPARLVPMAETTTLPRSSGKVTIAPQQNVIDTVVFEAPAQAAGGLKLLLPQTALPLLGPGYIGYDLTAEYLTAAADSPPSGSSPSGAPLVGGFPNSTGKIPIPGLTEGEMPAAMDPVKPAKTDEPAAMPATGEMAEGQPAQPTDEPKKLAEPPSVKDLDKLFRGDDEKEKMAEKEKMDQPKTEEPAKP